MQGWNSGLSASRRAVLLLGLQVVRKAVDLDLKPVTYQHHGSDRRIFFNRSQVKASKHSRYIGLSSRCWRQSMFFFLFIFHFYTSSEFLKSVKCQTNQTSGVQEAAIRGWLCPCVRAGHGCRDRRVLLRM